MRYWAYLVAKLAVAGAILLVLGRAINLLLGHPETYLNLRPPPFGRDLTYTFAMLLLTLFGCGLAWLIVWDQRNRCRTCLRRLRMPVGTGSWSHMLLLGRPKTEYICVYGHGTLKVADLQITGRENPDWQPHNDDIWAELAPKKPQPVVLPPAVDGPGNRPQKIYSLGESKQ
jgi:hypothetical protein